MARCIVCGQLDVLDLDDADLDAPRLGLLVDDLLELGVDLLALASSSSSSDWPSTDRIVVWAICIVAPHVVLDRTMAASGSTTRK
jgi:hypothetical protein